MAMARITSSSENARRRRFHEAPRWHRLPSWSSERLAADRPGWRYVRESWEVDEVGHVTEERIALLDEARQVDPECQLRLVGHRHEHDEDCYCDDCSSWDWRHVAAVGTFLGRQVANIEPCAAMR